MREQFAGWGLYDHYAICINCRHKHLIAKGEQISSQPWMDWQTKHAGHAVRLVPYRLFNRIAERLIQMFMPGVGYAHNADVKVAYVASAAYTCTLTGLATSSTLTVGRESTWVSNASNKYLDELVTGKLTPAVDTANTYLELWAAGVQNDTPTYPSAFTGTDSGVTIPANVKAALCKNVGIAVADGTDNQSYYLGPTGLRQLFGDALPVSHGLWVVHSTGNNLNATASNQALNHTPVYATVT